MYQTHLQTLTHSHTNTTSLTKDDFYLYILLFRALWSNDERRPLCWQLDSTEGPSRVRRRLIKAPRYTDEKFLLSEAQIGKGSDLGILEWELALFTIFSLGSSPLSFIFEETAYDSTKGLVANIVLQEGERL